MWCPVPCASDNFIVDLLQTAHGLYTDMTRPLNHLSQYIYADSVMSAFQHY